MNPVTRTTPPPVPGSTTARTDGDDFDRASRHFGELQNLRGTGRLNDDAFRAEVAKLRVSDPSGTAWQIAPDTGAWLRWDGKQWCEAEPPLLTADGESAVQPTLFVEFERHYRDAVAKYRSGKLTESAFRSRIERLTIQDAAGWWQIRPSDGHWLKWSGSQWIPDNPPREQTAAAGPARRFAGLLATSAKEESKSAVRSMFAIVFQQIIGRVVMMVAAYFVAINLHGYLLGVWNEGKDFSVTECAAWLHFHSSTNPALNQSVPPPSLVPPAWSLHAIWGSLGMVIGSLGLTVFRRGPFGAVKALFMMPVNLWRRISSAGTQGIGALLVGAGVAILASRVLPLNPQAKLVLAASTLIFGVGLNGRLLSRFLLGIARRMISAGLQARSPLSANLMQLALIGVAPGLYLAYKLAPGTALIAGGLLAAAGAALAVGRHKPLPEAATTVLMLVFQGLFGGAIVWLLNYLVGDAHADDGGKSEYTGPPENYWKDNKDFLVPPSGPAGTDAITGVIVGGDVGDNRDKDDKNDPKNYTYSLVMSPRVMNHESPYNELSASARVIVTGPDPAVAAALAAQYTDAIQFSISGNCASWFDPPKPLQDIDGKTVGITVIVPDEATSMAGPHAAALTASVSTPVGMLSRSCSMTVKVVAGYELSMEQGIRLTANDISKGFRCGIICRDTNIDTDESNAVIRKATPSLKFQVSGPQANWFRETSGEPGALKGEIVDMTPPEVQAEICAEVPSSDLQATAPFSAEILASAMLEGIGSLALACSVEIAPPEWFIEARWIKQDLVLDGKDAAEFEARLIPMLSDKINLYGGEADNQLNRYLEIRASGANAGNAVITEKEGTSGFRAWKVTFSPTATECPADTIDLEIVATLCGAPAPQQMQILVSGKPRIEVVEKSVSLLAGGDPVTIHAQLKDGGKLNWTHHVKIPNINEVEPTGPPVTDDDGKFTLELKGAALEPGDFNMRQGTLILSASAKKEDGETIETDPVEVSLRLSQNGLSVTPTPVKLPLDPNKEKPTYFSVRVLKYDKEKQTFEPDQAAMQKLEMEPWEDGDFTGGANVFKGAGVELLFVRFEGSGTSLEAVWSAKQKILIPASQIIDAVRLLRAPGDWGDQAELYETRHTFTAPVDPASLQDAKIRREQENCRKTLRYLPDGPQKTKFSNVIEKDAIALGAEGLYHLRHTIWEAARDALTKEAESYMRSANVLQALETACNWGNYLCGIILNGMAGVLVPFPGDLAVTLLYDAIPDLVNNLVAGKSISEWFKGWGNGLIGSAPGMAADVALNAVVGLENVYEKALARFKNPIRAAEYAGAIFLAARVIRYQAVSKPDGEPHSLMESIRYATRDLIEEMATLGISKRTAKGKQAVEDLTDPTHIKNGIDPKDGRIYTDANKPPDIRGMPDANVKAAQDIAKKHNVDIFIRPTNPASKKLLDQGAHPKPEMIKTKTINELDLYLGMKPENIGKVGWFDPGTNPPPKGKMSDAQYADLVERFDQRKAEFNNYKKDIGKITFPAGKNGGHTIKDGVILHPDGKPYTGDHDIFDIRKPDGTKPTKAEYDAIIKDLKGPPFNAQHDGHRQWDYSTEKWSDRKKKNIIDSKILDSHQTKKSNGDPGEALIKVNSKGELSGKHFDHPPHTPPKGTTAGQAAAGTLRHDRDQENKKGTTR